MRKNRTRAPIVCVVCGGTVEAGMAHALCRRPDDPGVEILNPIECAVYLSDPSNPRAGYTVIVTCNGKTLIATDVNPSTGLSMGYREAMGVAYGWCTLAEPSQATTVVAG